VLATMAGKFMNRAPSPLGPGCMPMMDGSSMHIDTYLFLKFPEKTAQKQSATTTSGRKAFRGREQTTLVEEVEEAAIDLKISYRIAIPGFVCVQYVCYHCRDCRDCRDCRFGGVCH
jgi:hypothetical protein